MTREELEHEALRIVSPDLYYDLADTIGETPDEDLYAIIACDGVYDEEVKL